MHKINTLNFLTAPTPTGCVWVGTNKGNVIMMTVHIKSPATKEHPRTVELNHSGNLLLYLLYMCMYTYYVVQCKECACRISSIQLISQ